MTEPAEAFPDFEDEELHPDVAAHLGRTDHTYELDGEVVQMPNPGNFPMILQAYMLNRFGKEARWIYVQEYQRWLREYEVGRFVTAAIDAVYENEKESVIDPALQSPMADSIEKSITHAIVIEEVKDYLPPDVDPSVLYDPPFEHH